MFSGKMKPLSALKAATLARKGSGVDGGSGGGDGGGGDSGGGGAVV